MDGKLGVKGEVHSEANYPKELMKLLNDFRKRNVMCDVVLIVSNREYYAHQNIISAASPYLLEKLHKFLPKNNGPVHYESNNPFDSDSFPGQNNNSFSGDLSDICTSLGARLEVHPIGNDIMEDVLNFMYLGEVCVHQENVRALVAAADYLRMVNLKEIACRFFEKRLCPSNCLSISALADEFSCESLKKAADMFVFKHFTEVCCYEEFKGLDLSQVIHIISNDDIEIEREEQVYDAAMTWLRHILEDRIENIYDLISHVRLPCLSLYFIVDCIEPDDLVMSDPRCRELVTEAKNYLALPDRSHIVSGIRYNARKSLSMTHALVACGGNQDRLSSREVLCYVPSSDFWYPLAPMIHSRFSFSTLLSDNYLYAIGGYTDDMPTNRVERYNFAADRWEELVGLPQAVCNHGAVSFNGEIYVIGGGSGDSCSQSVYKFIKNLNRWELVTKLKVPRRGASVVAHKHLYVIGGYGPNGGSLASVERFDSHSKEWAKIFPMNSARAFASAICIRNKIFIFGGEYATWSYYRTGEVFNIDTDEWSSIADMSVPRAFMGIAALNDVIYLVGGMVSNDDDQYGDVDDETFVDVNEINLVECYDLASNKFHKMCSLPMATAGLSTASMSIPKSILDQRCGL